MSEAAESLIHQDDLVAGSAELDFGIELRMNRVSLESFYILLISENLLIFYHFKEYYVSFVGVINILIGLRDVFTNIKGCDYRYESIGRVSMIVSVK